MEQTQTWLEPIASFNRMEGNLRIWGKLYIDKLGRTVGGWLVHSWSESGLPYWQVHMHWVPNNEAKAYAVQLSIGFPRSDMNVYAEDKEIEPERLAFIIECVSKWKDEWMTAEMNKQGG